MEYTLLIQHMLISMASLLFRCFSEYQSCHISSQHGNLHKKRVFFPRYLNYIHSTLQIVNPWISRRSGAVI